MKRLLTGASLLLIVLAVAGLRSGRAQQTGAAEQGANNGAPPPANPLKVAILHWYRANLTTSFKVGKQPYCVAFDGANIWSANNEDNTVTKLRANDGENLGTFPVGEQPDIVAFDGANIWVGNYGDGTVSKLRASDGKSLGTFTTGLGPTGLAFDGENIWVTGSPYVVVYRDADGAQLGKFHIEGSSTAGLAFDGANMWVAATYNNALNKM